MLEKNNIITSSHPGKVPWPGECCIKLLWDAFHQQSPNWGWVGWDGAVSGPAPLFSHPAQQNAAQDGGEEEHRQQRQQADRKSVV